MEEVKAQVQGLTAELLKLRAELEATRAGQRAMEVDEIKNDEDGEEEDGVPEEPSWLDVLGTQKRDPQKAAAGALVALLGPPPPLDALREAGKNQVKFNGIPETPPARRHKLDNTLTGIQNEDGHGNAQLGECPRRREHGECGHNCSMDKISMGRREPMAEEMHCRETKLQAHQKA